jgi:hypothetical protein
MNDDEVTEDNDQTVRARLAEMRLQHQDLDAAISALEARPQADQIQIARLKKRKLSLRDDISALEDQITPDIIA